MGPLSHRPISATNLKEEELTNLKHLMQNTQDQRRISTAVHHKTNSDHHIGVDKDENKRQSINSLASNTKQYQSGSNHAASHMLAS
ncbi:MAG: hypothetical protein ACMG6E_05545 [Candidatus Roizmanbacteria bacterium]